MPHLSNAVRPLLSSLSPAWVTSLALCVAWSAATPAVAQETPAEGTGDAVPAAPDGKPDNDDAAQPNVPSSQPAYPSSQPALPSSQPAYPSSQPALPSSQPAFPSSQPASTASADNPLRQPLPPIEECAPTSTTNDDEGASTADRPAAQSYTNRPGASDTTAVLPHGALLLQAGFTFSSSLSTSDTRPTDHSLTVPDLVLRAGLFDWVEMRFGTAMSVAHDGDTVTSGIGGAMTGLHVRVLDEDEFLPAIAATFEMHLPVATLLFQDTEADARLNISKTLFDVVGVGSTLSAGWHDQAPVLAYTLAGSMDIGGGVIPFLEVFGSYTPEPSALPDLWVDGGVSIAITDAFALDASAGINAAGEPSSFFVAAGVSALLPPL